jgi:hypothetical protein
MRKVIGVLLASIACLAVGPVGALAAPNPSETGKPGQSCQEIEKAEMEKGEEVRTPGNAASSLGSPFNEEILNSPEGGIGGQHYSPNSQYDVACFQLSTH